MRFPNRLFSFVFVLRDGLEEEEQDQIGIGGDHSAKCYSPWGQWGVDTETLTRGAVIDSQ